MSNIKETDLFIPVKKWLQERGFRVYSEVSPGHMAKRADVVAVKDNFIVVVELKTSLSLELISQAVEWKGYAHHIFVAVPNPKNGFHQYAKKLLSDEGIGLLPVDFWYDEGNCSKALIAPRLDRRISPVIGDWIKKHGGEYEKLDLQGGHRGGGYLTPYKSTIDRVKDYLNSWSRKGKWVSLGDILEHCETHYSDPKSSLSKALREFENDTFENTKIKGKLHFRVKEKKL